MAAAKRSTNTITISDSLESELDRLRTLELSDLEDLAVLAETLGRRSYARACHDIIRSRKTDDNA